MRYKKLLTQSVSVQSSLTSLRPLKYRDSLPIFGLPQEIDDPDLGDENILAHASRSVPSPTNCYHFLTIFVLVFHTASVELKEVHLKARRQESDRVRFGTIDFGYDIHIIFDSSVNLAMLCLFFLRDLCLQA